MLRAFLLGWVGLSVPAAIVIGRVLRGSPCGQPTPRRQLAPNEGLYLLDLVDASTVMDEGAYDDPRSRSAGRVVVQLRVEPEEAPPLVEAGGPTHRATSTRASSSARA